MMMESLGDTTFWEVIFLTATYTVFALFVLELLGVALYLFLARRNKKRLSRRQFEQRVVEDINSIAALADF